MNVILVCYGKKFGPKGYGYGQGGGALQSDCYANGYVDRIFKFDKWILTPITVDFFILMFKYKFYFEKSFRITHLLSKLVFFLTACYAQLFGPRGIGHAGGSYLGLMSDVLDNKRQRYICVIIFL